jgi:nucleoside-diphosphate-sugar epimerase
MSKLLVVGETSFIGKHLSNELFDKVSYKDFQKLDLSQYDVVLNCALNPLYKTHPYDKNIDVDLNVGLTACKSGCHYVMISTSKVYGNSEELKTYTELSEVECVDHYSKNKLITENILLGNFPTQVTILRGSNIFGFEYGRNSFVGYCMSQLVNEGLIEITIDGHTKRDFLYVEDAAKIIEKVCEVKPLGVYNMSSNQPVTVYDVCENLIRGYPYLGGIVITGKGKFERQFLLDNTKLKEALKMKIGPFDFENIFYELGKRLCKI